MVSILSLISNSLITFAGFWRPFQALQILLVLPSPFMFQSFFLRSGICIFLPFPIIFIQLGQNLTSFLFSWTDSGLCIYHLSVWTNFSSLAQFPVDHLSYPVIPTLVFLFRNFPIVLLTVSSLTT